VFSPSVGVKHFLIGWKNMFSCTPSIGAAGICGCTWSWSWEHDKFLNKGSTRFDQTQHKYKQ
jgi:hypothetical protein